MAFCFVAHRKLHPVLSFGSQGFAGTLLIQTQLCGLHFDGPDLGLWHQAHLHNLNVFALVCQVVSQMAGLFLSPVKYSGETMGHLLSEKWRFKISWE